MFALNNEIIESFSEINKAIYRLVKKESDRLGITVVQLKALYKISTEPDISLGELAERLRLTNSTVSGVIDRLVHHGLVERIIPPENRRSISIHLTDEGKSLLSGVKLGDSILLSKIKGLMDLPEEEKQQLLRLHKLVLEKLSTKEE